jgi:hypothetical protein
MPKAEAHRDTIEIQSGRSASGSGLIFRGRTYYRKEEIWLCPNCYQARSLRRGIRVIGGIAILLIVAVFFSRGNEKPQAVADSSAHADRTAAVTPLQGVRRIARVR